MTDDKKKMVEVRIVTNLTWFMEACDAEQVCEKIINDVIEDIEECADEDFNWSDIDIALSRVFLKKFGITE
jgi:hypothetical protein